MRKVLILAIALVVAGIVALAVSMNSSGFIASVFASKVRVVATRVAVSENGPLFDALHVIEVAEASVPPTAFVEPATEGPMKTLEDLRRMYADRSLAAGEILTAQSISKKDPRQWKLVNVVIARRAIAQEQVLAPEDLVVQSRTLMEVPKGALIGLLSMPQQDMINQLAGQVALRAIGQNEAFHAGWTSNRPLDELRPPKVCEPVEPVCPVQQGEAGEKPVPAVVKAPVKTREQLLVEEYQRIVATVQVNPGAVLLESDDLSVLGSRRPERVDVLVSRDGDTPAGAGLKVHERIAVGARLRVQAVRLTSSDAQAPTGAATAAETTAGNVSGQAVEQGGEKTAGQTLEAAIDGIQTVIPATRAGQDRPASVVWIEMDQKAARRVQETREAGGILTIVPAGSQVATPKGATLICMTATTCYEAAPSGERVRNLDPTQSRLRQEEVDESDDFDPTPLNVPIRNNTVNKSQPKSKVGTTKKSSSKRNKRK